MTASTIPDYAQGSVLLFEGKLFRLLHYPPVLVHFDALIFRDILVPYKDHFPVSHTEGNKTPTFLVYDNNFVIALKKFKRLNFLFVAFNS
jgi:hypothetical protein